MTGQEIGTGRVRKKGHEMDIERGVTIEVGITTKTRAAPVVAAGQDRVVLRQMERQMEMAILPRSTLNGRKESESICMVWLADLLMS